MSYSTDYRPLIKLGVKGIASVVAIACMKDAVEIISYIKKRNYQPGESLTWEEIKDNVEIMSNTVAMATMMWLGFTWESSPSINKDSKEESKEESKEDSKEESKEESKEDSKGPLTFTGTLEQLQEKYKFTKPFELYEKTHEGKSSIWSKTVMDAVTKCAVEGSVLLDQERLKQNQVREYRKLQQEEMERLAGEKERAKSTTGSQIFENYIRTQSKKGFY